MGVVYYVVLGGLFLGYIFNIVEFVWIVGFVGYCVVGCYCYDFFFGVFLIVSLIKILIIVYFCEVFCLVWIVCWQEEFDCLNRMVNFLFIGVIC